MVCHDAKHPEYVRYALVSWLLRALHAPQLFILAGAVGLLAGVLRGAQAPVPSLTLGGLAAVPVVAVLALISPLLVVNAWLALPQAPLTLSPRATLWGSTFLLVVCGGFAVASAVFGHIGALIENCRNVFGLLGLVLLGARFGGQRGSIALPIGYLILAFMLGRTSGSTSYPWAWILRDGGDLTAFLWATVLAVAGGWAFHGLPKAAVVRGEA